MKEIFRRHPRDHAVPDDLWVRCPRCEELLYSNELEAAQRVCSKCKYHFGLTARERIALLLDEDSFQELDATMHSADPLAFVSETETYRSKLEEYAGRTDTGESFIYGPARIDGQEIAFGVTEFKFAGGSMGAVFGEKVARAIELARRRGLPLVIVSSGGGARMHEGAISLLQMAKTVAALDRFKEDGLPFISIMADPCLGGMTASYAMLGDVNIAEPGAYIGFAGRRVIEQTMRQKLPADAATAEFLQKHGFVDIISPRAELPALLARLLCMYVACNPAATRRRQVAQYA